MSRFDPTYPPATSEPKPEPDPVNTEGPKNTYNTNSNSYDAWYARQSAWDAAQQPKPKPNPVYTENPRKTNNTRPNAYNAYDWQSAWTAQQRKRTAPQNSRTPKKGHASTHKAKSSGKSQEKNPPGHQSKSKFPRRRGFDPSGHGDESEAPSSGGYSNRNFVSPTGAGGTTPAEKPKRSEKTTTTDESTRAGKPAEKSQKCRGFDPTGPGDEPMAPSGGGYSKPNFVSPTGAGETTPAEKPKRSEKTTTTEESTRTGKPAEKSQKCRGFDPTGSGDEPMAPSGRGYSKPNFVSPTGAGETTPAEEPTRSGETTPTEERTPTEEPAPTDKPTWPFFGEYELKSEGPTHTEKPDASEGQQPLTRPLLWIFEGSPSTDNKGERFSARDSKQQVSRASVPKGLRRHVQTRVHDEFTCRVTYCTTNSGVRGRIVKCQDPPAIEDLIARFKRLSIHKRLYC
jgi:hypothetical protein